MSPLYVPPHKRFQSAPCSGNSPEPKPVLKYAFFGDSFVRLFGLVEHPSINVQSFKGASAKGLGRSENENAAKVIRYLKGQTALERCIFVFGNVDVHMSYFYKKYVLEDDEIDLKDIAKQYVEFVASLSTKAKRTIIGVYPSPLEDKDVCKSLVNYGSLKQEQVAILSTSDDVKLAVRQERVKLFNRCLALECEKHGIEYTDLVGDMLDESSIKIREEYRDVSDRNIHVVWETTILLWLDKWPWFKELTSPSFQANLNRTLKKYLATKPWAERTHAGFMRNGTS